MRIDALQCFRHRLQRGGGARRILVVDGHHERRERRRRSMPRPQDQDRAVSRRPPTTEPAANAIQPRETAKKKIIVPCNSVMLAKRTTCSI